MIRDYEDRYYPMLCHWWKGQKFPPPPQEFLPSTGYIANETAAGFLYLSNSAIVWMEWVVVNPGAAKDLRVESINEVIAHIVKQAAFSGAKMVFTSVRSWPFEARLKTLGFEIGDQNMTNMFRKVG